jgi:dimethylhistidine N-methyltransferase
MKGTDMSTTSTAIAERFTDGVYDQGLADVLRGLVGVPRQLSPIWLYDERGCRLFEKICDLPEYYLTRTETGILHLHAAEMADAIGAEVTVIEFGSGTSHKTRLLLDHLRRPSAYVPVDIAASSLARAARVMRREYPRLRVLPLCADFTHALELPDEAQPEGRRLIYFPGSTLGNFEADEARRLLGRMRELAGADGQALIGIDLRKEPRLLCEAYDDRHGVTAEFNLNALRHLNRRLGTCFEVSHFNHRAQWIEAESRIEMHLVSAVNQTIRIGAAAIRMPHGDYVRTECCHKYSQEAFAALAGSAGWSVQRTWTDPAQWFSVQLLTASHSQ